MPACISPFTPKKVYENQRYSHNPQSKYKFATHKVPCGKCFNCLQRRAHEWAFRLEVEREHSDSAYFITLTYHDKHIPKTQNGMNTLNKRDVQLFLKRLRKHNSKHTNKRLKYYLVGEYGGITRRAHYHAIIYNVSKPSIQSIVNIWGKGFVQAGIAQKGGAVAYTTNYIMNKKQFIQPDYMKVHSDTGEILYEEQRTTEFSLMSKNLGKDWLTEERIKYYKENKLGVIVDHGGQFKSMPRYYKDKIFTKSEKLDIAEEFADQFNKDYNEIIEKLGQTEADRLERNQKNAILRKEFKLKQVKRLQL